MSNGGKSKAKGSAFERKICKDLSLWITDDERDDLFWRSSNSGGRATIVNKEGGKHTQSGDISAIHPLGHQFIETFVIECKHYKNIQLEAFIFNGTGVFKEFWKQVRRDARKSKKHPLLIAKQNNRPILLGLDREGASIFQWGGSDELDKPPSKSITCWFPEYDLFIFDYEIFLLEHNSDVVGTWRPPKRKKKK